MVAEVNTSAGVICKSPTTASNFHWDASTGTQTPVPEILFPK